MGWSKLGSASDPILLSNYITLIMQAVLSNLPMIVVGVILTVVVAVVVYLLFLRPTTEGLAPVDYQDVPDTVDECQQWGNALYDRNPEFWSQTQGGPPCGSEIERYSAMHGYPPTSPFAKYPEDEAFQLDQLYV